LTTGRKPITLIGEEIAGDWNAAALADIANVFGGQYLGYDAADADPAEGPTTEILARYDCLLAAENLPGAQSAYTFRPPAAESLALLVGNEAKGLRRRTLKQAHSVVEIPLASGQINCLNVAAAAAVLLTYLTLPNPLRSKRSTPAFVRRNRPELLLVGGGDAMELGSTIRSACAFGWDRVLLDDRGSAWYECDRRIKSEGRGAARRGRNPIRVIPQRQADLPEYRRTIVFSVAPGSPAPHETSLTGGDVLIALPDESTVDARALAWPGSVTYVSLPRVTRERYHYHQMTAIAMAEVSRQLGERTGGSIYLRSGRDRYRRTFEAAPSGTELDLEDLSVFLL
jgi:hypothetical protein